MKRGYDSKSGELNQPATRLAAVASAINPLPGLRSASSSSPALNADSPPIPSRCRLAWLAAGFSFLAGAVLPLGAQDLPPVVEPAAPAAASFTFADLMAILTAVVFAARLIVKFTPTPADDSFLEKIVAWLKHLGLNVKTVAWLLLPASLLLGGCHAAQRPPSAFEQKFFVVTTNFLPAVTLQTNRVVAPDPVTGLAITNVLINVTTNFTAAYAFAPGTNATVLAQTAGSVANLAAPGLGSLIVAAVGGLFGLWGIWRSRQAGQMNASLAQTIETGLGILRALPDGVKYETAWKTWMIKHQAETGTIAAISKLVANVVDNETATAVANQIVALINPKA